MNTLMKNETTTAPAKVEREAAWVLPTVNIYETREGYVLEAEMPGVNKTGLEITMENNELTLAGHRALDPIKAEAVYRETRPAEFRRTFEIDPSIDASKITAHLEQGLLTLRLPKAERIQPRKISVA